MTRAIERIWAADALGARALAPLGWAFGAATAIRNAAYDAGLLRAHSLGMPSVSVGNLSVGGTGKTPVSAMIAQWFVAQGLRPAIQIRGYREYEPVVHGPLCMMARWKSPPLLEDSRCRQTLIPPADSPKRVTLCGLPPKAAMFACVHRRAAR